MFSTKEFIEASRSFVCVRLESYESPEHQELVRTFLNGRFENTAFCLLAPDGETRLTRSSRSPSMVLGATGRGPRGEKGSNEDVVREMEKVATQFKVNGKREEMVLQDFHSFRQALNVASGDQRLLLFLAAEGNDLEVAKETVQPLFANEEVIGRFHFDQRDPETDAEWGKQIEGSSNASGYFLIQSDQFGQKGTVVAALPITADAAGIKAVLLKENEAFAAREERKVYSEHVSTGRREGIFFENGMPYGEDRDGDGEIDHRGGKGGKGGKGKGPRP